MDERSQIERDICTTFIVAAGVRAGGDSMFEICQESISIDLLNECGKSSRRWSVLKLRP